MSFPPTSFTVVSGGINRLRTKAGPSKDALYDLLNGYVTQAGTVKVRPGTLRNADLTQGGVVAAGATKGLVAYQGQFHVFGTSVVPVPAGYQLHILSHPAANGFYVPPNSSTGLLSSATVDSLLHFEDGDGSTAFTDTLPANVWTAFNGGVESTAFSYAGSGSGKFISNTNGNQIATPVTPGSVLDIFSGGGDFTVEWWFFQNPLVGTQTNVHVDLTDGLHTGFEVYSDGADITTQIFGSWTDSNVIDAVSILQNGWNHVAVCRKGTVLYMTVNGQAGTDLANWTVNIDAPIPALRSTAHYHIGEDFNNSGANSGNRTQGMTGYIDEFRITKGQALYTGVFPIPAVPLTTQATIGASQSALLHFEDGNGSVVFSDSSPNGLSFTPGNGAVESTTQAKFGTGSLKTTGTNDYIRTPQINDDGPLDLADRQTDWTISFWVYPTNVAPGTDQTLLDFTGGGATGYYLKMSTAGKLENKLGRTVPNISGEATSSNSFIANQWNHVAICYSAETMYIALNGQVTSASMSQAIFQYPSSSSYLYLGANYLSGTNADGFTNGYIDEFYVVKGYALYTTNFTPPTSQFLAPAVVPVPLKEIHFAAPYLGGLYVVAEFDTSQDTSGAAASLGSVFHYWIQSSMGSDNANEWQPNTDYQIGDVVIPTPTNGYTYIASRRFPANPSWTASTPKTVGDVVEPTVANGFEYTVQTTLGTNPSTSTTEPTWPTTDGATVIEQSALASDQVVTPVTTAAPQATPSVPPRYTGLYFPT